MAKPAVWYFNAARRTVQAVWPRLAPPDDAFAAAILPPAERRLYLAMDSRDRRHACDVAKAVLAHDPAARSEMVRAALLHDVGKAGRPYRVIERILVHLLPDRPLPAEPRLDGLRGAMQMKVHHQAYGAEMIRAAGGSEAVARLVARHHVAGGEAELLRRIDERT